MQRLAKLIMQDSGVLAKTEGQNRKTPYKTPYKTGGAKPQNPLQNHRKTPRSEDPLYPYACGSAESAPPVAYSAFVAAFLRPHTMRLHRAHSPASHFRPAPASAEFRDMIRLQTAD